MGQENETAAICGLYCGTCPSYGQDCDGCLSDRIANGCDTCGNGFRECAKRNHATRCYECAKFPCRRLEDFSTHHIVNGICHHEHVIDDLYEMKMQGVESWVKKQKAAHTCKTCGNLIYWFDVKCSKCSR